MDASLGLGPDVPMITPSVKARKIITPVKVFKIAMIVAVVLIGSYGLFIDKQVMLIAFLMIQGLFIIFLAVMAILGIKDKTKEKNTLSHIYLAVASLSLILGIISLLDMYNYW